MAETCLARIPKYCTGKNPSLLKLKRKGHTLSKKQSAMVCDGCRDVITKKFKTEYSDIQIENDLIWAVMRSQVKYGWLDLGS